jgi:hypothetical protein
MDAPFDFQALLIHGAPATVSLPKAGFNSMCAHNANLSPW